jgi:2-haloacid dehalogenase
VDEDGTTAAPDAQQTPETVVFDLGNVLIRWDPAPAFHGVLDPDDVPAFLDEIDFAAWNHEQDAGRSWDEAVRELTARHPHHADVIAAYVPNFLDTLQEMPDTVALLGELQEAGVRLLALTNWSAELFAVARKEFAFLDLFDGIVVSGEERVAKPDPRVFEILLERYGVDGARALFVDDSPANVAAARQAGLRGVVFTDVAAFRDELQAAGLIQPRT